MFSQLSLIKFVFVFPNFGKFFKIIRQLILKGVWDRRWVKLAHGRARKRVAPVGLGQEMLIWSGKVRSNKIHLGCKNKYCHMYCIFSGTDGRKLSVKLTPILISPMFYAQLLCL